VSLFFISFNQAVMSFIAQINHIVHTVRSSVSVDFVHQNSDSVSINTVHHSWHAD